MSSNDIEPFGFDDEEAGWIVEMVSKPVTNEQFLREFTQNSIEAIEVSGGSGHIYWQNDPEEEDRLGAPKISIVDNGVGMTGEEMRTLLNKGGKTTKRRALDGNFGIGAKISSMTQNPVGVVYESWKDGKGSRMVVIRNDDGDYGLQRPDGKSIVDLKPEYRPMDRFGNKLIGDHGTKVTLLGKTEDQITMVAPDSVRHSVWWMSGNLNRRYFNISPDIEIRTTRLASVTTGETKGTRRVYGQKHYLEKAAVESGVRVLSEVSVHWWIIPKEEKRHDEFEDSGHIAALYENELYDWSIGIRRRSRMSAFGIHSKRDQVVLYVAPRPSLKNLIPSLDRKVLKLNEEDFPWEQYGSEFNSNMPRRLKDFINKDLDSREHENRKKWRNAQDERIRQERIDFPKYVKATTSDIQASLELVEDIAFVNRYGDEPHGPVLVHTPPDGPHKKRRYSRSRSRNAQPAKCINVGVRPEVIWKQRANGSRDIGEMEDRMSVYVRGTNQLYMNADFRSYEATINREFKNYEAVHDPYVQKVITDQVRAIFEMVIVDHIAGSFNLSAGPEWTDQQIDSVLTTEVLTTVAMQRSLMEKPLQKMIRDELSNRPAVINEQPETNEQEQPTQRESVGTANR